MASPSLLIKKIADYLRNRDKQTNFGECRRCEKKVYWSTSKVASHIRSGHCQGASEDEVQQFKQEFVYDTPKNLVHKSVLTKKFKDSFDIEEYRLVKSPKVHQKKGRKQIKAKLEVEEESFDDQHEMREEILYEDYTAAPEELEEEKIEIVFLPEKSPDSSKAQPSASSQDLSREEKFIQAVYPQFKGKTKLQLIEDILDLKRRNDLLQVKAKTYENTINRLLN